MFSTKVQIFIDYKWKQMFPQIAAHAFGYTVFTGSLASYITLYSKQKEKTDGEISLASVILALLSAHTVNELI